MRSQSTKSVCLELTNGAQASPFTLETHHPRVHFPAAMTTKSSSPRLPSIPRALSRTCSPSTSARNLEQTKAITTTPVDAAESRSGAIVKRRDPKYCAFASTWFGFETAGVAHCRRREACSRQPRDGDSAGGGCRGTDDVSVSKQAEVWGWGYEHCQLAAVSTNCSWTLQGSKACRWRRKCTIFSADSVWDVHEINQIITSRG